MESYRVLSNGGKAGFTLWGRKNNCEIYTRIDKILQKLGVNIIMSYSY